MIERLLRNFQRFRNKATINAVHDDDLQAVLSSSGTLEAIIQGQAHCVVCGNVLSLDNIAGWKILEGKPHFFCDRPACSNLPQKGDIPIDV